MNVRNAEASSERRHPPREPHEKVDGTKTKPFQARRTRGCTECFSARLGFVVLERRVLITAVECATPSTTTHTHTHTLTHARAFSRPPTLRVSLGVFLTDCRRRDATPHTHRHQRA